MKQMGEIMFDVESLLDDMIVKHDLQAGDVLNLIYGFIKTHYPESVEEYTDGTNPVFYYGPAK